MSQKKVSMKESLAENDDTARTKKSPIESKYKSLVWEKRILIGAFVMGVLGTFLFIISFSTEFWIFVRLEKPQKRSDEKRGGAYLKTGHYHGLWRICREELWQLEKNISNKTTPVLYCRKMYFALPEDRKKEWSSERVHMELKMLDFRRSTIAVGFIALMLAFLSHAFTFYSLDQLRYMYKRLAGCLHLLTGASCWVTLEVFRQMHMYEERNMKEFVPEFSEIKYGWSYSLIWFEMVLYIIPGIILLACSRKKREAKPEVSRKPEKTSLSTWADSLQ